MKCHLLLLLSFCLSFFDARTQEAEPVISDSLYSKILGEQRQIRVILPKQTGTDSTLRYEITYILDGEWYEKLVPFCYNFAQSAGYAPKSIFVLLPNRIVKGENLRLRDFSVTKINGDSISGGADSFYNFLTQEVVPYVEAKYASNSRRTLVGSSLSGLFSVYAFLKDPAFFHSFIASDPSLWYGDNHIKQITPQALKNMPENAGTLYVAGLKETFREMGIQEFDSLMKVHAPSHLHWKCNKYENESHYSVQLKAFYDGSRFSHYGYSRDEPEIHPMKGLVLSNRSFQVILINNSSSARYSTDGSEPGVSSPIADGFHHVGITTPVQIRVRNFPNRPEYVKQLRSEYASGFLRPVESNTKATLQYAVFEGESVDILSFKRMKPAISGFVDSLSRIRTLVGKRSALVQVKGIIDIESDGEYIFGLGGYVAARIILGNTSIIEEKEAKTSSTSFIASLKKGKYPFEMLISQKASSSDPWFKLFRVKSPDDEWWKRPMLEL